MTSKVQIVTAAAVIAAAAATIGVVWILENRKSKGRLTLQSSQDCTKKCSEDPACKSCSYNPTNGQCILSSKDPFAKGNWVEDPSYVLYVRRDQSEPGSFWTEWSPATCPKCGDDKTPVTRHRTCSGAGHCVGNSESLCPAVQPCATFTMDKLPHNTITIPYESDTGKNDYKVLDGVASRDLCDQACLDDTVCTSTTWLPKSKQCHMTKNYHPTSSRYMGEEWGDQYSSVKLPTANVNGEWGDWPRDPTKPCLCGMTQIDRPCKTPPCSQGISHAQCPTSTGNTCAYDQFPATFVQS